MTVGPGEVGRVLVVEFSLLWANDWFVVPVPAPTRVLMSVADLVVTDTFGVATAIAPAHEAFPDEAFQLYRLTHEAGSWAAGTMLVPQVIPASLQGHVKEEVTIVRDESANVGWPSNASSPPIPVAPSASSARGPACREPPAYSAPDWRTSP